MAKESKRPLPRTPKLRTYNYGTLRFLPDPISATDLIQLMMDSKRSITLSFNVICCFFSH